VLFAHDTEQGLAAATALVNTAGRDGEQLPDLAALDEYTCAWEWTGQRTHDQAELQAVHDLRSQLRRLWEADEEQVVSIVNGLLRDANALPQLVRHGSWGYHLHATRPGAPLATWMAVEAAMAFLDLVRAGQLDRLRICAYPGCGNVLVDLSKNRSKRYCDTGCGNRAAVDAYRGRLRSAPAPSSR
jgi:predicted RNA-binding Zn ribbon-like protein